MTLSFSMIFFGGGNLMVREGISYDRRTDLVLAPVRLTMQRYVNNILRPVVVPMAHRI